MSAREVVVAGYGMAAARFVEEVRRADPDGRRIGLTVIGEEPGYAYNRVLLTSVLTGRMRPEAVRLQNKAWVAERNLRLFLGVAVEEVDRVARSVTLASGERIGYDALVLATGSRPRIPPTDGLRTTAGELSEGVHAFRTLAGCDLLREQVRPGTSVAVLGGGVLGLELARALSELTSRVTVVHPMAWIMERQLDETAGRILVAELEKAGVRFSIGRYATRYEQGSGLWLDDGSLVPAQLVVVSVGACPEVSLAREAGLEIDRGVVVDEHLRTSDPRIFAIGDCAQYADVPQGFVEPAWEQAGALANVLLGERSAPPYRGSRIVTTLKVPGVEVMTLGDPRVDLHAPDAEVLCLADPAGGRYAKLVLRDDRIEGAILLGLPGAAASVAQHYTGRSAVPLDRLALLLGRAPAQLPDLYDPAAGGEASQRQVMCVCNNVTLGALTRAWDEGARSADELVLATRATTGCGSCAMSLRSIAERLSRRERVGR